jgi:hypothetical protein
MENKTVADLRAFVESFEPEYPLKKGYIIKLLMDLKEKLPVCKTVQKASSIAQVLSKIKVLVQTAEPDRCLYEDAMKPRTKYCLMLILHNAAALKCKKKNLTTEWCSVIDICQEVFSAIFTILPTSQTGPPPQSPIPVTDPHL